MFFYCSYTIKWTLFSQNPILSYDLRVREVDHSTGQRGDWRHYSVTPDNSDSGPVRRQEFRLDNLSQFNGYEVDLEAVNSLGKTRYCFLLLKNLHFLFNFFFFVEAKSFTSWQKMPILHQPCPV